jgi:general secretion pathway protein C
MRADARPAGEGLRVLRTGLLSLNGLLLLGCGYLLATSLRTLLFPAPVPAMTLPEARPVQKVERSFDRYREIAGRDLFGGGPTISPPPTRAMDEKIEESQLRLRLIGTAYASDPVRSVAVLEDETKRERMVVRAGYTLPGTEAEVARIERGRLILKNRGRLEAIEFTDEKAAPQAKRGRGRRARTAGAAPTPPAAPPRGQIGDQLRQLAEQSNEARSARRRAQSILTQARIVPRYGEDGSMSGLEVNAIRSGSLLENAGFQNGDLVVGVNGTPLSDPAQGLKVFRELATAERFVVEVQRGGGVERIEYAAEEGQ